MDQYSDKAPFVYFSSSENGNLLEVNQFLCTTLGFAKEELAGKKIDAIFTLATRIFQQTHLSPLLKMQRFANEIFITLQSKTKEEIPVLINAEYKLQNGEALILYAGIPVYNRKKFEDELIAAKKAAEKALEENTALTEAKAKLQEHMEQLDEQVFRVKRQNEELKRFNHVVTHDLQEPVRKLSLFTNMLLENKEGEKGEVILKKLTNVTERMRSIVSGLQQYVWLTEKPGQTDRVDLTNLLHAAEQRVNKEYPGAQLDLSGVDLPPAWADAEQMQVLFYHLLANAARFRKPGTPAKVQVMANKLQANRFRNVEGKYDYINFLKIQVSDQGIGVDPRYKEQVFELFKRLHTESGPGIGLSLCKKIVENHQGEIQIDSVEGQGSTITILLPQETRVGKNEK